MIKEKKIGSHALIILLFLYSLGIGNWEKYFVLIFFVYVLFGKYRFRVSNSQFIPLILWGVTYSIMYILRGNNFFTGSIYYLISPLVFFLLAKKMYQKVALDNKKEFIKLILFTVSLGFFFHGTLNILSSALNGTFNVSFEYVYDIWSHKLNNRTIIGLYLSPIVFITVPMLFFERKSIKIGFRIICLILLTLALLQSIYIGNRTILVIFVLLSIICLLIIIKDSKKKFQIIGGIIFVGMMFVVAYQINLFGLKKFILSSHLIQRNAGLESSRWQVYREIITNFFEFIGGWMTGGDIVLSTGYAHNMWLDIYIFSGIVPTLFFLIYTIRVLREMFKCYQKSETMKEKLMIVAFVLGILLNWAVEPVLEANPYYVSVCIAIFSLIEEYAFTLRKNFLVKFGKEKVYEGFANQYNIP